MLSVGLEIGTKVKIKVLDIQKDTITVEIIYIDKFWSTRSNTFILNEKLILRNMGTRFDYNNKSFVLYNIDYYDKKPWYTLCIYDNGNHTFEHYR